MNIKDIARLAETSPSTVSRVINSDPRVSREIREKVLRVIQRPGTSPIPSGGVCAAPARSC